ncbi:hypothetical protein B0H66DRAFT_257139 [Apodospora peruviana]|uniref:AB hydrolase-1 domain-containing protein n=1 Tax=Apodospora peruviana TaxID=516989 RepID=A0AAE0I5Z7_9PEZI|nr:hypothetical protein B0H66DRAFT_257139 [Apodospora peruviana]
MSNLLNLVSFGALALAPIAAGAPSDYPTKQCVQLEVTVPVVATNHHFGQPPIDSNITAINWTVNTTTWNYKLPSNPPIVPIDRTFKVHAQLCVPSTKNAKSNILQIATQGRGFDKRYFDIRVQPETYSYLDAAIKRGYPVLTYDRIGLGESEKPDPYDVVQLPAEVEILAGLTKLAKAGKLISSSKVLSNSSPAVKDFVPSKIVQVGHSYGSFIIAPMIVKYGSLADGALLTGFFPNPRLGTVDVSHYDHAYVHDIDPVRWAAYGPGYFILANTLVLQKLFLHKPGFEPALLTYMSEILQPEAVGEYPSGDSLPLPDLHATEFTGPVQISAGAFDFANCKGDCRGQYNATFVENLFPKASNITGYLQPDAGHAMHFSTTAPIGYKAQLDYLNDHGL